MAGLRRRVVAVAAALVAGTAGAVAIPAVVGASPADGQCTGWWYNDATSSMWRRDFGGRLYWDMYLSSAAQAAHTSPVTVTMPWATLNGQAINPPYGPHTMSVNYDFHGSVETVQFIGGGSKPLMAGDTLTVSWFIDSLTATSYAQMTCVVPALGAG